jgi:hypothetical protein
LTAGCASCANYVWVVVWSEWHVVWDSVLRGV